MKTILAHVKNISCDLSSRRAKNIDDLVESISKIGIVEPLIVSKKGEVLSGVRRFAAAKKLRLKTLPIVETDVDTELNPLITIDANLMQLPLNSAEFDRAILERKRIYEEFFPESVKKTRHKKHQTFSRSTAKRLGVSKRTVELAVSRARNASDKVKKAQNTLGAAKVNELAKLSKQAQDKLIAKAKKMKVIELKRVVSRMQTGNDSRMIKQVTREMRDLRNKIQSLDLTGISRREDIYNEAKELIFALQRLVEQAQSARLNISP